MEAEGQLRSQGNKVIKGRPSGKLRVLWKSDVITVAHPGMWIL